MGRTDEPAPISNRESHLYGVYVTRGHITIVYKTAANDRGFRFLDPLGKDPKTGGPPHGLEHQLYEQLFTKPGEDVVYNDSGHVCEDRGGDKAGNALVRVDSWVPENTFPVQKGKIMVSVWRRWKA